ncbi:MAG: hypothetical protein PHG69_00445 [Candidatus Omnitrophica bacterium]|nr:hypothetical protein [Candidatus Omnitrophota bacterium]
MMEIIKRNKEEIILAIIFIFFALGFNIYRVQSDGLFYYSFLEHISGIPNPEFQSFWNNNTGFHQSGCAYFNALFYIPAYLIEKLLPIKPNFNGITLRQISINLASNFYLLCSILLTVKILKRLNLKNIILPVVSILFSTSAFTVAVITPSFHHTVDIFVNTLFIYLLLKYGDEGNAKSFFWLGLLYVIAILVRYSNFILIIAAIIYFAALKKYKNIKYILLGTISIIWIIPLLFFIYNGSIFHPFVRSKGTIAILKGCTPLIPIHSLKYLIHPLHGIFIWSPPTILSAIGLLIFTKTKEKISYLLVLIWVLLLFLYGYVSFWHAGWSFSNRYLVNLFTIYVIGLSFFLEKNKRMKLLVIILTIFSVILFLNWYLCIMNGEFGTPGNMIEAWISGKSDTSIDKVVNLKTFFHRLYEMCRYKYLIRALK